MKQALESYKPTPTLQRFHENDDFLRYVEGPLASGKTTGCLLEIAKRCREMAPMADGIRHSKWLVHGGSYLWQQMVNLFIGDGVDIRQNASQSVMVLSFDDVRAEIYLNPADMHRMEFTGAFIDAADCVAADVLDDILARVGRFPGHREAPGYWYGVIACGVEIPRDWVELTEMQVFRQPGALSADVENADNLPPGYYRTLLKTQSAEWCAKYLHT